MSTGAVTSRTSEKVLDAGLEVPVASGWEGLSLQAAAQLAGVNRVTFGDRYRARRNSSTYCSGGSLATTETCCGRL